MTTDTTDSIWIQARPTFKTAMQFYGISGGKLAETAGISRETVYKILRGERGTHPQKANAIARAFAKLSADITWKEAWPLLFEAHDPASLGAIAASWRGDAELLRSRGYPQLADTIEALACSMVSGTLDQVAPGVAGPGPIDRLAWQQEQADQIMASDMGPEAQVHALLDLGLSHKAIGYRLGCSVEHVAGLLARVAA